MSPTKSSSTTTPLSERSPNTASPTKSAPASPIAKTATAATAGFMDGKPVPRFDPLRSHHQAMGQQSQGQSQSQTYISPSDAIASPTTKKLSEIKGRRFMNAKPQTLFAKTLARENLKMQSQNQDQTQTQSQAPSGN